jgi:hypothetical protein
MPRSGSRPEARYAEPASQAITGFQDASLFHAFGLRQTQA